MEVFRKPPTNLDTFSSFAFHCILIKFQTIFQRWRGESWCVHLLIRLSHVRMLDVWRTRVMTIFGRGGRLWKSPQRQIKMNWIGQGGCRFVWEANTGDFWEEENENMIGYRRKKTAWLNKRSGRSLEELKILLKSWSNGEIERWWRAIHKNVKKCKSLNRLNS